MEINKTKFENIFYTFVNKRKILLTKNLTPSKSVYGENLFVGGKDEYREWKPDRSKLASAILKGINFLPIKKDSKVLYLGAASGTTSSHISDILEEGYIFCIDFSPRVVRDLVYLCELRENMSPILADAAHPEVYKNKVSRVNIIYQDIAQRNQIEIFFKNIETFLSKKDFAILAVKARSIDVTKNPHKIFKEVENLLDKKLKIIDKKDLTPFQKDHMFFITQVK